MNESHAPDVVYPLKRKSQYEELRYSLRSLQNVPHGKVWIAGEELPSWITGVNHVRVERFPDDTRYSNAERNWIAACLQKDLSDEFIAMNDDFFIMQPIERVEYFHDGSLREYLKYRTETGDTHENYLTAMQMTIDLLKSHGIDDPLGYTLHVPMLMNKHNRLKVHDMFKKQLDNHQILLIRTLYGNLFDCGGTQMKDVKFVNNNFDNDDPIFFSSNDTSFKYERIGELIRAKFPKPSQYER